jgi:hypothetical protein
VQTQNPTAERVRALAIQALKEANIEEQGTQQVCPVASKGPRVYWQSAGNRIELVVDRDDHIFGALHCTFSILPIAYLVAQFFLEDAAAISTLVAVFEYLQGSLSDLLPGTAEGIQARSVYRSFPGLLPHQKHGLKFVPLILGASLSRRDLNYQQRNKALRGGDTGEWRGGSLPDFPINDEQRALISSAYPDLLRHWQKIKKLRQNKSGQLAWLCEARRTRYTRRLAQPACRQCSTGRRIGWRLPRYPFHTRHRTCRSSSGHTAKPL